MSLTALISNISRDSLHDGSGIRTVVYFKGCGMRCRWCHNPENLSLEPDILYIPSKCIGCGECIAICPEHHKLEGNEKVFLREGCLKCGKCVDACPTGALSVSGKAMTVDEVFEEIKKSKDYFISTGGGVTLSGGECLLHSDFAKALLEKCHQEGIHTVIESAFFVQWEAVEKILPFTDLIYADLKLADSQKHLFYTGQANDRIIENIGKISLCHDQIIIRIPLIPGVNDSVEEMAAFAEVIDSFGDGIKGIELLRYNTLAETKYEMAGMCYESFGESPQTKEQMDSLCMELQKRIVKQRNVFWRS